jgi:serine/threonine protein kinase
VGWEYQEGQEMTPGRYAWSLLGAGRRHETWLAWDEELWTPVVVKIVDPAHVAFAPAREAIAREAVHLRRLRHPGFPRLIDQAEDDSYLVSEFVEGDPLSTVLEEAPLSPIDAVLLVLQIASTLRALHGLGLVHMDVTPGNLILRQGRPVVIDLGLTVPVGWCRADGVVRGTRGYLAPERYAFAAADPAADVYGLGAVLYEMLTGDPAYETRTTEASLADRQPPTCARGPRDLDPDSPASLDLLVRRCLDPDPRRRPAGMSGLLTELADLLPDDEEPTWPQWATPLLHDSGSVLAERAR